MPNKHLVLLVHGIGSHEEGWSDNYVKKITDLAVGYDAFTAASFKEQVEFKEVAYDKIFRDQIQNWEDNVDDLITAAPVENQQSVRESLDWMNGVANQDENFLWTHVADAVLWKISSYLRNHIMTSVAHVIATSIDEQIRESAFNPKYSIIGHSMGTSVIQKTITALNDGAWSGDEFNAFQSRDVQFKSIHMISNVSHYFETEPDEIYDGIVRPGIKDGARGYCHKYFNYTNRLDPISWAGRFSPDWTADDGYHDIVVSHLHGNDVHDIGHYLINPKVHIPLIRSITRNNRITPEEEIKALDEFKQIGGEFQGDVAEYKEKLQELKGSINEFKDLGSWIKGWTSFGQLSKG